MIFSTSIFLVFFLVVFIIYWLVIGLIKNKDKKLKARIVFLLFASYYFYMSWNPLFILLILFSTLVDYLAGKKIYNSKSLKQKKLFLILSIIANLGFLAYFKYANFFLGTINYISGTNFIVDVILPLGISFYTFQSMCYTIDIYYKKIKPANSFFEFSLYVAFFPQLIAGPIVRAREFLPQLKLNKKFKDINFQFGVNYILLGLVKKVVIADNIASISDALFSNPDQYGTLSTWMSIIAFHIQIYCDFSGYADIAIGIAALLGFKLAENFNMPYNANNITEFWRRWHISLSSWFRDYLFIPLGGSRVSKKITLYRNILLTFIIAGLWHGASWNMIVWGALHGLALVIHKFYRNKFSKKLKFEKLSLSIYNILCWFLTTIFLLCQLAVFRAHSFNDTILVLKNMFTYKESVFISIPIVFIVLTLVVIIGHVLGEKYFHRVETRQNHIFSNPYFQGLLYGIVIFSIVLFANDNNQVFIYFQF